MSEQVSTFLDVDIGTKKYLFFIVAWNDYVNELGEELDKQFPAFGEDLGVTGTVIKAYKSAARSSFDEVLSKSWPAEMRERFDREQDPFMLVIDKGFKEFDPESHHWAVVWFSDFYKDPGSLYRLFGALSKKVRKGDDVLAYLKSVARKEKFKKVAKYFEFKTPKVFGVSIDIKAIAEDLLSPE